MEYQGNFQDMIERYNRELMNTYQKRQDMPAAAETEGEVLPAPRVTVPDEAAAPLPPEASRPPERPAADTRPRYPLYERPAPVPVAAVPMTANTPYPPATDYDPTVAPPMEMSFLQVWVTTATSALPVEGAIVTVSADAADGGRVQYTTVTDRSGRTEAFPLPAASRQLSLTPTGDLTPYTLYDIEVAADGFYRVENVGLPLYGGVRAIQPVKLIPLPEYGSPGDTQVFRDSAPQDLNGEEADA